MTLELVDEKDVRKRKIEYNKKKKEQLNIHKTSISDEECIKRLMKYDKLPVKVLRKYEMESDSIPKLFQGTVNPTCGVYIATTKYNEIYIGSSVDIIHRIYKHKLFTIKGRFTKKFYLYITENEDDARKLEDYLIFNLDPELNVISKNKKCHRMSDLEMFLLKKQEEHRRKGLYDIMIHQETKKRK